MEFIMENYVWFAAGGIFLLMTLVGYIADKSNFVNKQKTKDKQKEKDLKLEKERIIKEKLEEQKEEELKTLEETIEIESNETGVQVETENIVNLEENLNLVPEETATVQNDIKLAEGTINLDTNINPEITEELVAANYEKEASTEVINLDLFDKKQEEVEEVSEISNTEIFANLEATNDTLNTESLNEIPSTLSLDETNQEITEDDVWKF